MGSGSSTLSERIITLLVSNVEEKEAELGAIKEERDKERELLTMGSGSSTLSERIITLLVSNVEEKEAELGAIKEERDKEREKNEAELRAIKEERDKEREKNEAELRAIKEERDKEREKNELLTLEIKALQKQSDDLLQECSSRVATVRGRLEKLGNENEVLKREKEEMEGKIHWLTECRKKVKAVCNGSYS